MTNGQIQPNFIGNWSSALGHFRCRALNPPKHRMSLSTLQSSCSLRGRAWVCPAPSVMLEVDGSKSNPGRWKIDSGQGEAPGLTDAAMAEIDKRLAEDDSDPDDVVSREIVKEEALPRLL